MFRIKLLLRLPFLSRKFRAKAVDPLFLRVCQEAARRTDAVKLA